MIRLLKRSPDGGLELEAFDDNEPPTYAILSHTWIKDQEVTHRELLSGRGKEKTGYTKIGFCVDRAAKDKIEYSWVDTCCIDKSDPNEMSRAVNSMFRWYQRAAKCYVYLSDVQVSAEVADPQAFPITWAEAFRQSRWFTRGWTLQELLAPPTVEFFSGKGVLLGSKIRLEQEIHKITKIPIEVLRGHDLSEISVEERMSWATNRSTTVIEDKVYCLLGIFGVFLPLLYGEGEAYATLRLNDEIERRQKGRGTANLHDTAAPLPLPFPKNGLFVGRQEQLQSLEQSLLLSNTHCRTAVYGLGGCGKSALAIEFAYRALAYGEHQIFWIPAMSQESFELAYRKIGTQLRIPGITDHNADINQLVKDRLNSNSIGRWLLIVDNVDDRDVLFKSTDSEKSARLYDYIPFSQKGKVLFTTRSKKIAGDLSPSSMLELKDMSNDRDKEEARQLLERRISRPALLSDNKAVNELLEILTYLPLAIVQAAAFMDSNEISASDYISLFQEADAKNELFGERFEDYSRYQEMDSTIARTWYISFDQMRRQDILAAEYLSFMACIDRINIPQSLLPLKDSRIQQIKAIGTLKGYAFITEHQQGLQEPESDKFFDMHRLVHMTLEWWLDEHDKQAVWRAQAAARLEELIPYGSHRTKELWTTYLPHAIYLARPDGKLDEITRASLLQRVGLCQQYLGQYSVAESTVKRVLLLGERNLGNESELVLSSMYNLAIVINRQGRYKEAESMYRQALVQIEKVFGPEHPYTLFTLGGLAKALKNLGKYEKAEAISRQALAHHEKVLGPKNLRTLTCMGVFAGILSEQGKYEEAKSMHRQILARREKVLGPEHPETLQSMSNLAVLLAIQGTYEEAKSMDRQTLARRKKVLGPEHPETLQSMNNLAVLLGRQGNYEEAKSMHRQTLALREKVLGPDNPDTLKSMNRLAVLLDGRGKYEEAESMYRQILALREKVLGPDHLDTTKSMDNLTLVLLCQSKYEDAESMLRQTLALREKIYGHRGALSSMDVAALILVNRKRYEKAELMYRQILALRKEVLGPEHPDTLTNMNDLAAQLDNQGKYEEAESMTREILARREKVLGPEHPDTLASMRNLAFALSARDKNMEAISLLDQCVKLQTQILGADHSDTLSSSTTLLEWRERWEGG